MTRLSSAPVKVIHDFYKKIGLKPSEWQKVISAVRALAQNFSTNEANTLKAAIFINFRLRCT